MPNNAVGMMTFAESKHWSLSLFEATDLTTFFSAQLPKKSQSLTLPSQCQSQLKLMLFLGHLVNLHTALSFSKPRH